MALSRFDVESAGSGMFGYRTERDDGPAVRLSHRWIGLLLGERGGVVRGRICDMHRSRDQNLSRAPGKDEDQQTMAVLETRLRTDKTMRRRVGREVVMVVRNREARGWSELVGIPRQLPGF